MHKHDLFIPAPAFVALRVNLNRREQAELLPPGGISFACYGFGVVVGSVVGVADAGLGAGATIADGAVDDVIDL